MRIVLAASTAAAVGLIVAGALGVAGAAETTTTGSSTPTTTTTTTTVTSTATSGATALTATPPRSVSVEGVANESIADAADAATATAVYRQGISDAIADAQTKAQFLASKTGATLGAVQSIVEGDGNISCPGALEYEGEQPDFGSGIALGNVVGATNTPVVRAPIAAASKPVVHVNKKARKRHSATAKKAAVANCTLSAQVFLVYALS
jgi:hypothetical protein